MSDKERNVRDVINDVNKMAAAGVLIPQYEVEADSYICFVVRNPNGRSMLHAGRMGIYPEELQKSFLGLFLNEHMDNYKVIGIYQMSEWAK
jgi:hypothetical protein